jgi:hypothetical protein
LLATLLQRVCGRAVPTEGVVGVVPGSSIINSASEAPVLLLKTRLVTSVLFKDTVIFAVGTELPAANVEPPVQKIAMSPSNSA